MSAAVKERLEEGTAAPAASKSEEVPVTYTLGYRQKRREARLEGGGGKPPTFLSTTGGYRRGHEVVTETESTLDDVTSRKSAGSTKVEGITTNGEALQTVANGKKERITQRATVFVAPLLEPGSGSLKETGLSLRTRRRFLRHEVLLEKTEGTGADRKRTVVDKVKIDGHLTATRAIRDASSRLVRRNGKVGFK